MDTLAKIGAGHKIDHWQQRPCLAATSRWTARRNLHDAGANHFSLSVDANGTRFLMNRDQAHCSRIRASDLLLLDATDPETMNGPEAPDPTT